MSSTEYNGWMNYETWNVSLWIGNDEGLYEMARKCRDYKAFVKAMALLGGKISEETPDGVLWNYDDLDIAALDEMIGEL